MRNSRGTAAIKLVIIIATAIIIVGVVATVKSWYSNGSGTVRFYSQAYFLLMNTEDNGFLGTDNFVMFGDEGVAFSFPDPNIDNKALEPRGDYVESSVISLWNYEDNELVLEMKSGEIETNLVGDRKSLLVLDDFGYLPETVAGPKYRLAFDKLYPNEVIMIEQWWVIPTDMADDLTLEDGGLDLDPTLDPTYARIGAFPNKTITGYFSAHLYKIDSENRVTKVVEKFEGGFENMVSDGWLGLVPV